MPKIAVEYNTRGHRSAFNLVLLVLKENTNTIIQYFDCLKCMGSTYSNQP